MLEEAAAAITSVPAAEAVAWLGQDDVVFVDVRDPREIEREGTIPGAFRCTRGMLEFWIDPDSPYHKPIFAEQKRFVFFCAMGWRSSLATRTAQEMGLAGAIDLGGGFKAWREAGGPVEALAPRKTGT
jgi:rhodanese-related sulfurtransferase